MVDHPKTEIRAAKFRKWVAALAIGAVSGSVLGFILGCTGALFIMDCQLVRPSDDPRWPWVRLVQQAGPIVGTAAGLLAGIWFATRRQRRTPGDKSPPA